MRRFLKRKPTIYILPTRMGGYLCGLIFLMFLLSVGYNNNLLLIFTLSLFALNFIWLLQTHFHLYRLKLGGVTIRNNHAGESMLVSVHWLSAPRGPWNWELSLENESSFSLHSLEQNESKTEASLVINERGLYEWNHLKVKTNMPFGLYRTWKYYPVKVKCFVYPSKLKELSPIELSSSLSGGEELNSHVGVHDISSLGPYLGHEAKRISWKHYARSGELLIKEGEESKVLHVEFSLNGLNVKEKEYLLSKMATQMVYCSRNHIPFVLKTEKKVSGRSSTERHLHECLMELATC